jgi:hypothetical protein
MLYKNLHIKLIDGTPMKLDVEYVVNIDGTIDIRNIIKQPSGEYLSTEDLLETDASMIEELISNAVGLRRAYM